MIDPNLLDDVPALIARMRGRADETVLRCIAQHRALVKEHLTIAQSAQSQKNGLSKMIGETMRVSGDTTELKAEAQSLNDVIETANHVVQVQQMFFDALMLQIPNIPADDVPDGADETGNVEMDRWGKPRAIDNPKDHVDITAAWTSRHSLMDFERATKVAGPRFVFLRGPLARLERALGEFMLDCHTARGWEEVSPPTLVNYESMQGTGQYPKFEDDAYTTQDGLHLIPTSEVSLTNIVRDEIVADLPIMMTAQTMCYRREAGSAGRDTKGMIRQHQFRKVELVAIARPEDAENIHNEMLISATRILRGLELPYRVVTLCTGDMGFAAQKTYDIEVWMPSQNTYREISSISNCGDFQARRMKTRFKRDPKAKTEFAHTLNGSGLAVGRTLVALLENYQRADGGVDLPQALWDYLGAKAIGPNGALQ